MAKVYVQLEGVVLHLERSIYRSSADKIREYLTAPFIEGAELGIKILSVHHEVILVSSYSSEFEKNVKDAIAESLGVEIEYRNEVPYTAQEGIHVDDCAIVSLKNGSISPISDFTNWFALLDCLVENRRQVDSIFPDDDEEDNLLDLLRCLNNNLNNYEGSEAVRLAFRDLWEKSFGTDRVPEEDDEELTAKDVVVALKGMNCSSSQLHELSVQEVLELCKVWKIMHS